MPPAMHIAIQYRSAGARRAASDERISRKRRSVGCNRRDNPCGTPKMTPPKAASAIAIAAAATTAVAIAKASEKARSRTGLGGGAGYGISLAGISDRWGAVPAAVDGVAA